MHPLVETTRIDVSPHEYIRSLGPPFAEFSTATQDSGNISYGLEVNGRRYFAKTAGYPSIPPATPKAPTFDERLDLLSNAIEVAATIEHPAVPDLYNVIETSESPILVYEWVPGTLVQKGTNGNPLDRFRQLPVGEIVAAIDTMYDVIACLDRAGWIPEDIYDGCMIYDFDTADLHVVDLDHSHRGPFTNTRGRMFGSSRFMAPEEFVMGAQIDQRTTTFLMGRIAAVFLSDASLDRAPFRGNDAQHTVLLRACREEPDARYQTVSDFLSAWNSAS